MRQLINFIQKLLNMDKKEFELKNSEIEMLRSGMNDNVNLLADDELSELFGGYQCGKNFCMPLYKKNNCEPLYCGGDFSYK